MLNETWSCLAAHQLAGDQKADRRLPRVLVAGRKVSCRCNKSRLRGTNPGRVVQYNRGSFGPTHRAACLSRTPSSCQPRPAQVSGCTSAPILRITGIAQHAQRNAISPESPPMRCTFGRIPARGRNRRIRNVSNTARTQKAPLRKSIKEDAEDSVMHASGDSRG